MAPLTRFGAAQSHEAGTVHHEDDVGQRRQVRAAGDAAPHHRADLRHVEIAPHDRVVVEDASGAILPRKDPALIRQIHAGGVHQVNDGDPLAHRDFLGADDLADGFRPPGAGLHGRIVRDHDDFASLDYAEPGDDSGGGRLTIVLVVGDEESDLEPRASRIQQLFDSLARRS